MRQVQLTRKIGKSRWVNKFGTSGDTRTIGTLSPDDLFALLSFTMIYIPISVSLKESSAPPFLQEYFQKVSTSL